jgi:hypothetical protein
MKNRNYLSIYYSSILNPPTNYILTLIKPFSFVWYVVPILKTGAPASTRDLFLRVDNEKHQKNRHSHVLFMLSDIILAQWQRPVASSEALDLLHQAMNAVTYRRIAMAIKTASKVGVLVDCCLFACCPGGRRGNTEQVVARWWRPVASEVALDMPHWGMPSILPWSTTMAIKMAKNRGAFVHHQQFCHRHKLSHLT